MRSFRTRLLIFTLIWFIGSAWFVTYQFLHVWKLNELRIQQSLHRELAVHMRDDNPLMVDGDYSPTALTAIFHTLMLLGPDFEIYFMDIDGNITTSGIPLTDLVNKRVNTEPIKQFVRGETYPILGDDPRQLGEKKVFSAAPIYEGSQVVGYLYVVIGSQLRNEIIEADYLRQYAPLLGISLMVILFFALGVYRLVLRDLLRPGHKMIEQVQGAATSEFRVSPDLEPETEELEPVADQYHHMMTLIQQQFVQLRMQESLRREYLLQLSHDLKTPLANILGYLETWKMQNSQGKSLVDTAYHNAQRLESHLQRQLNAEKSASIQPQVDFKPVDVDKVITEVTERFSLVLSRNKLDLVTDLQPGLTVIADEHLIHRVFDNLFENATRHSSTHSSIILEVKKSGSKEVRFELKNSISEASSSGSLGMGNRIVEAILSLHKSRLKVLKQDQQYIAAFSLPLQPAVIG